MDFQEFFQTMCMHYCNHGTLTYANHIFLDQFINEKERKNPIAFNASLPPYNDRLELTYDNTKEMIIIFADTFKSDYTESLRWIWLNNTKSINARAVHAFYELIKKHFIERNGKEINQFHDNYDWFRILYVLRQNTSHGSYVFKKGIGFPDKGKEFRGKIKPYPDTITWKSISIKRGQKFEPVINEVQISNLLSHILIFFTSNNDFNVGISRIKNVRPPK